MKPCKKCGKLPDIRKNGEKKMLGCYRCRCEVEIQDGVLPALEKWDELQEEKKNEDHHIGA